MGTKLQVTSSLVNTQPCTGLTSQMETEAEANSGEQGRTITSRDEVRLGMGGLLVLHG